MDKDKETALMAESIRVKACAESALDKNLFYENRQSYMLGFYSGYDHVYQQIKEKEAEIERVNSELSDLRRRTYHYHLDVHENKLRKLESQLSAATNENEKLREALKGIKNIDDIDDEAWMIAHAALTPNNEQNNIK